MRDIARVNWGVRNLIRSLVIKENRLMYLRIQMWRETICQRLWQSLKWLLGRPLFWLGEIEFKIEGVVHRILGLGESNVDCLVLHSEIFI